MWYKKLLIAVAGVAAIGMILLFYGCDGETESNIVGNGPILRSGHNIVLHEAQHESRPALAISASEVVEKPNQVVILNDFNLIQAGRLNIQGKTASYDMKHSVLEVKGDVTLQTRDGVKAFLNGLIWERRTKKAYTDNPVKVQATQGLIEARRAEFDDDFTSIRFIGGVHAKISENYIID
ncbi:MAG: hypothetical protein JW920_05715 [Deltaproteobacteria bacterium]|nr:hypothetical protein [Deltaproteobacteria bacterium]